MKKQINPTIKAHLIRGAFYLLLLVAVCAIPFALAQRNNAAKRTTRSTNRGSKWAQDSAALRWRGFRHAPGQIGIAQHYGNQRVTAFSL